MLSQRFHSLLVNGLKYDYDGNPPTMTYHAPKAAIYYQNDETYNSVSLSDCQELCHARPWCVTYCLSSKTATLVGGLEHYYMEILGTTMECELITYIALFAEYLIYLHFFPLFSTSNFEFFDGQISLL